MLTNFDGTKDDIQMSSHVLGIFWIYVKHSKNVLEFSGGLEKFQ